MISIAIPDLKPVKCEKCRKKICEAQNHLYIVGGWAFCSKGCLTNQEAQIGWSRAKHAQDLERFG